jgi:hypothetical protein
VFRFANNSLLALFEMSALQIYSNSTNAFMYLFYSGTMTTLITVIYFIYKYINEYIENNNRTLVHLCEKLKQLHNLNTEMKQKITVLEDKLGDLSETQLNDSMSISKISNMTNKNCDDILNINREFINIKQSIPEYVLIGYKNYAQSNMCPIFVHNNFDFVDIENIRKIFTSGIKTTIIIEYLKYFENIREIKLDEFHAVTFQSVRYPEFNIVFDVGQVNEFYRQNNTYIPNMQDATTRNYYKNGLKKLRSLLSEMDIKLILNADFENFIR